MDLQSCLPDPELLTLRSTHVQPEVLWLDLESRAPTGLCPACGQVSSHRHSRHTRILKDVALLGRRVRLRLTVRKFFCDTASCTQRIFCERLPSVVFPWRRKTVRLEHQNSLVALEVGAESAARVLGHCGCPVSADALLAQVRRPPAPEVVPIRHLGVDDWAWRKGRPYGTIRRSGAALRRGPVAGSGSGYPGRVAHEPPRSGGHHPGSRRCLPGGSSAGCAPSLTGRRPLALAEEPARDP
ncbi:transposase family protein [Deinococcus planocerae]|uniref:transposase family protein n=1 Tax=Deinococcus planocerae TaxID=1737569 RepID=UPI000C7E9495